MSVIDHRLYSKQLNLIVCGYFEECGFDALFNFALQKPFPSPRGKPDVINLI